MKIAPTRERLFMLPYDSSKLAFRKDAPERQPVPKNVGLEAKSHFYVDSTCIKCAACEREAPETFGFDADADQWVATAQPETAEGRRAALRAKQCCPTFAIHTSDLQKGEMREALLEYPQATVCEGIYALGPRAYDGFGSASYLITAEGGENLMFDTPRYTPLLAQHIQDDMGGVKHIIISHHDTANDHAKWAKDLRAKRHVHRFDLTEGTLYCEEKRRDMGPWAFKPVTGSVLMFTPGHTEGSMCLLHKPSGALLAGDTLTYDPKLGRLTTNGFTNHGPQSQETLWSTVKRLMMHDWLHIFPSRGFPYHFKDKEERLKMVNEMFVAEGGTPLTEKDLKYFR